MGCKASPLLSRNRGAQTLCAREADPVRL